MLFRRLILSAVLVGALVGALLGLGEQFSTAPLIAAAEHQAEGHGHAHGQEHEHSAQGGHGHHGDGTAWAPADGAQRIGFTIVTNMGVAIGFSLLLMVAMYIAARGRGAPVNAATGAAWGLAGFAVVFVAPSLGLPPEVPGAASAGLTERQLWWLFTAAVTAAALAIAVFAPGWRKLPALVLLPLPYLFGAPEMPASPYGGHDAATAAALETIHGQFVWAAGLTNAVFWLVLGVACGWAMQRWVLDRDVIGGAHAAG